MKKSWIAGVIIAGLIGLNLVQGAALVRLSAHRAPPVVLTDPGIARLPAASQAAVKVGLKQTAPELRDRLKAVHQARRDLARYIASPHYNRAEAPRRFDDLRAKNDEAQKVAQAMLLNAADTLSPQDRALIVSALE